MIRILHLNTRVCSRKTFVKNRDQKSGNSWNAGRYKVVILHCNNGPVTAVVHVYCRKLSMCSSNVMFHDVPPMQ